MYSINYAAAHFDARPSKNPKIFFSFHSLLFSCIIYQIIIYADRRVRRGEWFYWVYELPDQNLGSKKILL
jgi:hypothetical protein